MFAVILVEDAHLANESVLLNTIFLTIGLSVLLHGLTATPLAGRYAAWFAAHPRDAAPAFESAPAPRTAPAPMGGRAAAQASGRRGRLKRDNLEPHFSLVFFAEAGSDTAVRRVPPPGQLASRLTLGTGGRAMGRR